MDARGVTPSDRPSAPLLFVALLLLGLSLALRVAALDRPLADGHSVSEDISAASYNKALNFYRYGYSATRGLPILNPQEAPPEAWVHDLHHPASFTLLQSLVLRLLGGPSLVAARLAPFLAVLAQLLLVYLVARKLAGPGPALASAALYATWPMTLLYAGHINYEPFVLASMLLFAHRILAGKPGQAALAAFLGGLFDFPGCFPPAFYALFVLVRRKGPDAIPLKAALCLTWLMALPGIGVLSLHFFHASFAPREVPLYEYVLSTLASAKDYGALLEFTWPGFLAVQVRDLVAGFGFAGLLLSLLGLGARRLDRATGILLASGVFYTLMFRYHAYVHAFWNLNLAPALALLAGPALCRLAGTTATLSRWRVAPWAAAALLLVAGGEGLYRSHRHQARVDASAPVRYAQSLAALAEPPAVVILVHPQDPPWWGVQIFTEEPAIRSSPLLSPSDLDYLARLLRHYHLHERVVLVALEESAYEELGEAPARAFLEDEIRQGRYIGRHALPGAPPDLPAFHLWEITQGVYARVPRPKPGR